MILPQLEPVAEFAVARLLNSLPEGLLIFLLAWATLRILPKQNSRTRFAVWFFALIATAGLPWLGNVANAASRASLPSSSNGATGPLARMLSPSQLSAVVSLPAHWAPVILAIWCAITLVLLARITVGLWKLLELRKSCSGLDSSQFDPSLANLVAELNHSGSPTRRAVSIAVSPNIRVPAALGIWDPIIVLPVWALHDLTPQDLAIVLRHEFAHLERWDDWTNLIQKVVRALFFFHPAVWWIESRLSVEREMACDDVVLAQTANPTGYATFLISLLERRLTQRGWTMAQALVHRACEASERLKRILDANRAVSTQTAKPALGLIGAFAALCVIALPHTPQVVAFEQAPALSASLSKSLIHPATYIQRPSVSGDRPLKKASKASDSIVGQRSAVETSIAHHGAPTRSQEAINNEVTPGNDTVAEKSALRTDATFGIAFESQLERGRAALQGRVSESLEGASAPVNVAPDFSSELASKDELNSGGMADTPTITLVNFIDAQPSLVFFRATQEFDSNSGTYVWCVQIWRVVVNPLWKHAPQISAAHST